MKELDYLMSLRDADDWFRQDYGTFKIETQEPPVKMCHLISATKSDGSLVPMASGIAPIWRRTMLWPIWPMYSFPKNTALDHAGPSG